MVKKIKKAVFPVAGLGTRFLPATKAMPKEMLTIVDRPVIQIAVDEAREAGIEHFIFVTGRNKGVIEDHFDKQYELEQTLLKRGKTADLDLLISDLPSAGQTSFTRQQEPLGLGHAVWCARELVGDEPFALLLPDMLAHSSPGCTKQMVEAYTLEGGNIIGVQEVPHEHTERYGIVDVDENADDIFKISGMVEKPKPEDAPSNLSIMGRYILQPEIFSVLEKQNPGAGGEIQLTDAMLTLMDQQNFFGYNFKGNIYDCGDKVGFLMANFAFALERPEIAVPMMEQIEKLVSDKKNEAPSEKTGSASRSY